MFTTEKRFFAADERRKDTDLGKISYKRTTAVQACVGLRKSDLFVLLRASASPW